MTPWSATRISGGNSNVIAYEIGPDWIRVQFGTGSPYVYSYRSAGPGPVERMKQLARAGRGLNSFINTHVKHLYVR